METTVARYRWPEVMNELRDSSLMLRPRFAQPVSGTKFRSRVLAASLSRSDPALGAVDAT